MTPKNQINILIINLARMGDILQSSPLCWALKQKYPNCHLTYLAVSSFTATVENIEFVDEIISFDFLDNIKRSIRALKGQNILENLNAINNFIKRVNNKNYDLAFNITHTNESKALTFMINSKETIGITMDPYGFRIIKNDWINYFYNSGMNRNINRINMVDIYLKTISMKETPKKLFFKLNSAARTKIKQILQANNLANRKYICVQLGASQQIKQFPPEKFGTVAKLIYQKYSLVPVFVGTKKEEIFYLAAKENLANTPHLNLMGQTSISELGALLENAEFLLTNDTGTMHISSGVNTRVIVINLATAYAHETVAYLKNNLVIEPILDCFPCTQLAECNNPVCKEQIEASHIIKAVELFYDLTKKGKYYQDDSFQIKDNQKFAKVRYLVSGFDSYNFLRLFPVIKRKLKFEDLLNLAFHYLWINDLEQKENKEIDYQKIKELFQTELKTNYHSQDINQETANFINKLEKIRILSLESLAICKQMIQNFKNDNLSILTSLVTNLYENDKKITDFGFINKELRPLIFQFQFGKENLEGNDTLKLLQATSSLYARLNTRLIFLTTILEK